jgi:hypothetical protein
MRFARHIPAPPLSEFVELLWLYEGYQQPHAKERLLPDGSMELVINLNEDVTRVYDPHDTAKFQTLRGPVMVGAHSEFFVIDTAEQQELDVATARGRQHHQRIFGAGRRGRQQQDR